MGGETSASEQKGVMQWTGTLLRNVACFRLFVTSVRACDVVCPLDTAAVTELWRVDLFSCSSSSFFCPVRCLREANVAIFCWRCSQE